MLAHIERRTWRASLLLAAAGLLLGGGPAAHAQNIQTLSNKYVSFSVNPTDGQFTIQTVTGDPLNPADANKEITFADAPDSAAVVATLLISTNTTVDGYTQHDVGNGNLDNAVFADGPTFAPDGRSIITSYYIPNAPPPETDPESRLFLLTQRVSLVRDLVRVEWTIENQGVARTLQFRVAIDPAAGPPVDGSDLATISPFFVPRLGYFDHETDLRPSVPTRLVNSARPGLVNHLPNEFYWFFPNNPTPQLQSVRKAVIAGLDKTGLDATVPDRVVFAGYDGLINGAVDVGFNRAGVNDQGVTTPFTLFNFLINPAQNIIVQDVDNGDATYALYYGPRPLGPGATWRIVTYLGVGVADHGLAPDRSDPTNDPLFVGAVQTPITLGLTTDPNDQSQVNASGFTTFGYAQNLRIGETIPAVTETLTLPEGLDLVTTPVNPNCSGQPVVPVGDLEPFLPNSALGERTACWEIQPNGDVAGLLTMNVSMSSPLSTANVKRSVIVPQGTQMKLRTQAVMMSFPFQFANPDPAVVFGLVPSQDFDIVTYDPNLPGYVPVTAIEPGRSYWVKLNKAQDLRVHLSGATPINLPSGSTFSIPISKFWNMVGNPDVYPVPLRDVKFLDASNGSVVKFEDAVNRGLIGPTVARYDRNTGTYVKLTSLDYVNPGEGIWMFAFRPLAVLWPGPNLFAVQ